MPCLHERSPAPLSAAQKGSVAVRWFAMSTRFLSDPKVEQLGEKHGPAGPLFLVSLLTQAAQQESGGMVEMSFRSLCHETFIDADKASAILDDVTELDIGHTLSRDVHGFKIELPEWKRWQATGRKAKQRDLKKEADKPLEKADVTNGHTLSRDVPYKTIHNKTKEKNVGDADAPLSHLLADLIVSNGSKRPSIGKRWLDAERLLITADRRDPAEAERLIRWSQESEFWRANVLSMPKFREKYDQLRLQAGEQPPPSASKYAKYDAKVRRAAA